MGVIITIAVAIVVTTMMAYITMAATVRAETLGWTDAFNTQKCNMWTPTGNNTYWNLIPGHVYKMGGTDKNGDNLKITVKVLSQVKVMDGIPTRAVNDTVLNGTTGKLKEIAIDYYSICKDTNSVFYFGEQTAEYANGKVTSTAGTWQHGLHNAHAGVVLPGLNLLDARYLQEVAINDKALDQARTFSVTDSSNPLCHNNCLKVEETTPNEPGVVEYKIYAPNVGIVYDNGLTLVR